MSDTADRCSSFCALGDHMHDGACAAQCQYQLQLVRLRRDMVSRRMRRIDMAMGAIGFLFAVLVVAFYFTAG